MNTSEHWQEVKVIFEKVLEIEPEQRESFLDDACDGKPQLRRKVEELLASFDDANSFLESPAVGEVASQIVKNEKLKKGETLNSYEIISQIGEGGMGEVYLARDRKLNRNVALKILSAHISNNEDRVQRFRQEAFATSALNHPNIITIYEISKWNNRDFIATEFIDGTTLRSLLHGKKLSIGEALDITLQIAAGLSAAHKTGIVHRDIKPENIMIREDRLVKILDFGIAKYRPTEDGQKALIETAIGEVIGTAAYMSPEQARGLEIDARTDIWSLGVILYEMLAGKLPFGGKTKSDRIVSILEHNPKSLTKFNRKIPPELEAIVKRSLAKEKQERYVEITEMSEDLQKVCEQTGIERHSVLTIPSAKRQSNSNWLYAALGLIILLLAGVGIWFYIYGENFFTPKSALNLQSMKIQRLSDTHQAVDVTISPDGEFVAFIKEEKGKQSLWLRQISAPSSVEIVSSSENVWFGSPTFSNDGSHIFYLKQTSRSPRTTLYQIPKLGGEEKKLVKDISFQDSRSNYSVSKNGKRVAFIRLDEGFARSLFISDLDGSNSQKLISRKIPEYLTGASFSPDGKTIATIAGKFGRSQQIFLVNTEDKTEKTLSDKFWSHIEGLTWFDENSLLISAAEKPGLVQLWYVSVEEGKFTRITNDLNDYTVPSLTTDSKTIAVVQKNQRSNIWITSPDGKDGKKITSGKDGKDGNFGLSFAPNGSVAYVSQIGGNPDVWLVNADGSSNKQLTKDDAVKRFPEVSPDGKYIIYLKVDAGENTIWRMDLDGENKMLLTKGNRGSFSPDGKWVYFYGAGANSLWKISIEGGEPTRVSTREKDLITAPIVSPDGTLIACNYLVAEPNAKFRLGVLPIKGGESVKIFDINTYAVKPLRWMSNSQAISFIRTREDISNIMSQSLNAEKTEQITNFKNDTIWNFDWSKDGKKLALSRGSTERDVILINDFK